MWAAPGSAPGFCFRRAPARAPVPVASSLAPLPAAALQLQASVMSGPPLLSLTPVPDTHGIMTPHLLIHTGGCGAHLCAPGSQALPGSVMPCSHLRWEDEAEVPAGLCLGNRQGHSWPDTHGKGMVESRTLGAGPSQPVGSQDSRAQQGRGQARLLPEWLWLHKC